MPGKNWVLQQQQQQQNINLVVFIQSSGLFYIYTRIKWLLWDICLYVVVDYTTAPR